MITRYFVCCFCVLIYSLTLNAQTTAAKKGKPKTSTTAKATVEGKPVTLSLKNNSEANVSIFAGKREDLKKPQLKNYGGLSKNTIYIKENDVVCIISAGKPLSCVDIKPGTTALEINSSGTVISKK